MIALNELLDNFQEYQEKLIKRGIRTDLTEIIKLENHRKNLQLKYESLKANTNKLCNQLAIKKYQNENLTQIYNEIINNEKNLKKYEQDLAILNKQINVILKSLPNLPDEFLLQNRIISKKNLSGVLKDFIKFIENIKFFKLDLKPTKSNNLNLYLKNFSNYVFNSQQNLLLVVNALQYILLVPKEEFDLIVKSILLYLSDNSLKIIKCKTPSTNLSSSSEFLSYLNRELKIKIEIKKEYFTREFNLKYRNTKTDMTQFFNQINIKICKN